MATFSPIRDIPQTGLSEWEASMLGAMKENIEILINARVVGVHAVMNDQITVTALATQQMRQTLTTGGYYTISGVNVPTLDDYLQLRIDLQQLANDLAETRSAYNYLLSQLKA